MSKTDQTMKDNINNYASQIITFTNFSDAVRKTPGQYIGYIGNAGFINMIREVLQNGMDELQKNDSPCTAVRVEYYEKTKTVIISDNGRGIPFGHMRRIYNDPNTSGNFEKKEGEFSAGRHGVGAKVTNALSSEFFSNSYLSSKYSDCGSLAKRIEFREGMVWNRDRATSEEEFEIFIPNDKDLQGTCVEFRPSIMIMGEITTTCEDVMELISLLLPLMKIGAIIDFYGVKMNGVVIDKHLVNEDGVVTFLICNTETPIIAPVVLSRVTGRMKADIAFTYDNNNLDNEDILSFANTCPTLNSVKSTHVSGFLEAITNYFRLYMNKIYLNKSKITVINNDIKCGLKAVVSVSHLEPHFSGQAKEIFSNTDIVPFIKNLMSDGLDEWCKTNSSDLQRLCKHFKDMVDLRMRSENNKVNLIKRYTASALNGLPDKYEKPNGTKNLELVIVEGDSAKAPAVTARCKYRQGIFPIRGKVANAMVKSKKDFFNNEECQGIMHILGCQDSRYVGSNFDITKCKFEKIIIMCDADLDGLHIRALLLKMFLLYYQPIIEAGRLYGAVPPLYSAKVKGKFIYFTSKLEYIKYIETKFGADNKVSGKTGVLASRDLNGILYRNSSYVKELEVITDNYAIDPYLLEYAISIRNLPFDKFKKLIKSRYRFLEVSQRNGITIMNGLVGEKCNAVIFNEVLMNACSKLFPYIDNEELEYDINGTKISLYGIMKKFESYKPPNVTRYKGLGEMNPIQLRESTLHPDYNRTLLRYTTEDIKKEIEEIREIQCNKALLLKDVDIAAYEF